MVKYRVKKGFFITQSASITIVRYVPEGTIIIQTNGGNYISSEFSNIFFDEDSILHATEYFELI